MRPVHWLGLSVIVIVGLVISDVGLPGHSRWSQLKMDATQRQAELDAEQHRTLRRLADKERIVAKILRNEMELLEAADHFQAADGGEAILLARLRGRYPGLADRPMYCRQVIDYLRTAGRPDAARAAADRMERDMRRLFPPAGDSPDPGDWRLATRIRPKKSGPDRKPAPAELLGRSPK